MTVTVSCDHRPRGGLRRLGRRKRGGFCRREEALFGFFFLHGFVQISAPAIIPSSTCPAEIPRTDLCVVGNSMVELVELVEFRLCSFPVWTSMIMTMRTANTMLNAPVAPMKSTELFLFPATPSQPNR